MSPKQNEDLSDEEGSQKSFNCTRSNIISKAKNQNSLVSWCMKVCQNSDNDVSSRINASTTLLINISKNTKYTENKTLESGLKEIALQSCINWVDNFENFRVKSNAFECLKTVAGELEDDFYKKYYRHVEARIIAQWRSSKKATAKLASHISACERSEKFRLLRTLSACLTEKNCLVEMSLFDEFPSSKWCKELLISYLLSINETWDLNQTPQFLRCVHKLDDFIEKNCTSHRIEDVLEILIENHKKCQLDLKFIMHVVNLISSDVKSLEVVTRDGCFLPMVIDELEILGRVEKYKKWKILYENEKQIMELHKLLFYPEEIIDHLLENIDPYTRIDEIINFFALLRDCDFALNGKIEFLRKLGESKSRIEEWKTELFRESVDRAIRCIFPSYERVESVKSEENDDKMYFSSIINEKNGTKYGEIIDSEKFKLHQSFKNSRRKIRVNGLLSDLSRKLTSNCDWNEKTLCTIENYIKSLDTEEKIVQLTNSLEILTEYEFDISESKILNVVSQSMASNVQRNVHDFVIKSSFPETHEKSLDELIEEILRLNKDEEISLLKRKDALLEAYRDVMEAYNEKSSVLAISSPIKDWEVSHVKDWVEVTRKDKINATVGNMTRDNARQVIDAIISGKSSTTGFFDELVENASKESAQTWNDLPLHNESIAVIKRTAELTSGIKLRDVQLLAVIVMLSCENDKGRLAQINTGEGKSIVIAMIAAYHAMRNRKVDVITSSPLLAVPQSEQQKPFFEKLGITVSHNINSSVGYKSDVVYGTSHKFQADILRDEFRQCRTRRDRKFDIAIVDEVDNMLIDGNNHIVLLSSEMPAMSHLEPLLAAIFLQVRTSASSIVERDGRVYYLQQKNAFDENGKVKAKVAIEEFPIEGTKGEFIQKSVELHLRSLIRDCDVSKLDKDFPEIKIPRHLRDFICKVQLKRWIKRAILAQFFYVKDEDYILDEGKIKIVDAKDTGVVKKNSHWSNGLHQLLEMKHGAKINPERLTSNYISNVAFFRRYGRKIYGLTGTLGTNGTKDLLSRTYEVDTLVVPPFRLKRYKELTTVVARNESDWYREIAKSCLRKLKNGRAVLVIMKYIRHTEQLEKILRDRFGYDSGKIKLYKTDADSSVVEEPLKSGDIVITTNIAGRGTDIKLSEGIDEKGGLHVCVTFLPKNSRVEQQNIGRTARTGNRGTSQFISWNKSQVLDLRKNRAIVEEAKMRSSDKEIHTVTTKDMIFEQFSGLLRLIEGRNARTKRIEQIAVEERFAIWKEVHNDRMENREQVLREFETFRKNILNDDAEGKLIKNAYMHVQIGNEYLDQNMYQDAIDEYTLAIDMDPDFAENAFYNRGYTIIAKYGNDLAEYKHRIHGAINDFKEARKLIGDRESSLHLLQSASDHQAFSDHVAHKLNLYNLQRNAIDLAIGPDTDAIDRKIEELVVIKKSGKLTSGTEKKEHTEMLACLKEKREEIGVIERARSKEREIKIKLLPLKDLLPADDLKSHDGEINEFKRNGYLGGFEISEIPPIDWWAIGGLLALGFGQLVIGAALMVFTLGGGVSFGMSLISEGISDIITAVKDGIINRTFSWATWAIEKAISIVVSVACAGFSAMKDVAKTVCSGARAVGSIGRKVVTETVKSGWKIVAKKVGQELAKGIGKQMAMELIDYGIDRTLVPAIQQEIINQIEKPIQEALMNNRLVKIMLELDEKNNNRYYENRIMTLGYDILSPEKNSTLRHIATQIATRIAANKSSLYSKVSGALSVGKALYDLTTFTSSFINKLNRSICDEAKHNKIDQFTEVEKKHSAVEVKDDTLDSSLGRDDCKPMDDDIDLNRLNDVDEQVEYDRKPRTPQGISNELVDAASASMIGIIKGKLINPAVQAGVNYSMTKITSSIDGSLSEEIEDFRAQKCIIHHQNKGFVNTQKKQRDRDIEKFGSNEVIAIRKIEELIIDTRLGGPSGLPHLGAASDSIGKPIGIYDEEGRLNYTIGDIKGGESVKVQYHKPKDGERVGHYTLPNSREPLNASSGKNMCLYNVIAEQTGHDPSELKNSTLAIMAKNKLKISIQAEDISRLERYSGMKLAMGGVQYSGKNPNDAASYIKNSDGKGGFMYPNAAHSMEHASLHGNTEEHLKITSEATNKVIKIYDKENNLLRTIDERVKGGESSSGDPIKLIHHDFAEDRTDEYFTSLDGNEKKYKFHDPYENKKSFYDVIAKQNGMTPSELKSKITSIMETKSISKTCVENKARTSGPKTAFSSEAELNLVSHYLLQSKDGKAAMDRLNKYPEQKDTIKSIKKDGLQYVKQVVNVPISKLGLPVGKQVFGGQWDGSGKIESVWPVKDVTMILYHPIGGENDKDAPVHVQTVYPRLPSEGDRCLPPRENTTTKD